MNDFAPGRGPHKCPTCGFGWWTEEDAKKCCAPDNHGFVDGQTIDLDCGCVLEYRGDLELWVVQTFCEEHDPTIRKEGD